MGFTFDDDSLSQTVDTSAVFQNVRITLWKLVRARRLARSDDPNQPSLEDDFRQCLAENFPQPSPNQNSQHLDLIWNLCCVQAGLREFDTYLGGYPRYYNDIHLGAYSHMETVMSRGVDQGNMLRHAEVLDTTALDSVSELMNFVIN
jgi:hypothetical protein